MDEAGHALASAPPQNDRGHGVVGPDHIDGDIAGQPEDGARRTDARSVGLQLSHDLRDRQGRDQGDKDVAR
ncbi:hypothetical protein D3C87_1906450 [compost metagenome]